MLCPSPFDYAQGDVGLPVIPSLEEARVSPKTKSDLDLPPFMGAGVEHSETGGGKMPTAHS